MQTLELCFSRVTAFIQLRYTMRGQIIIKFDLSSCFLNLACQKRAGIRAFCTRVYYTPFLYFRSFDSPAPPWLGMIRHLVYQGVALGRQGVSAV
jgi:hypothetical protein